jgi:hypothetical protein
MTDLMSDLIGKHHKEGDYLFYSPGDKECDWKFDHLTIKREKYK